ncbi:MAG: putative toxin-antitoxin system toxin component, PIN family [Spirochaetaceae bacterium]|nr:putative toxin-antitoxin system toxin component, PIN family [Spirochaetaceae bacterium]
MGIAGARLGCRDPDDDKVLEVALMGAADCIVTGDQDLLELASFRGLPILAPANFLERPPDTVQSSWPSDA